MTEDEAKTKWCPLSRESAAPGADMVNRCIGAGCMSWRWTRAKETKDYLDAVQAHMKKTGDNFNIATNKVWAERGSTFEQVDGYCGMAGTP